VNRLVSIDDVAGRMTAAPLPALTGLRFVAAISVVISHAAHWIIYPQDNWPAYGKVLYDLLISASGIGMPLFFVLSGFVIQYNYAARIRLGGRKAIKKFFIARLARIYPLYLLVIAYALWVDRFAANSTLPWFAVMVQSWFYKPFDGNGFVDALGPSISVTWSISTEWFFYCAFPLACLLIGRLKTRNAVAGAALTVGAIALTTMSIAIIEVDRINDIAAAWLGPLAGGGPYGKDSFFRWLLYFSPYSRIGEFLFGCLIAEFWMRGDPVPNARRGGEMLTALALVIIATTYFAFFGLDRIAFFHTLGILHMSFGFAPGVGLLIFCCVRYDNGLVRLFSAPWIVVAGEASYSLYLLHTIIIDTFPKGRAGDPWLQPDKHLVICIAACVTLSLVSWKLFEMPARHALRRLLSGKRTEKSFARGALVEAHGG
jgi:peptidoglycan/LPS O-acetylase OafA/YrhL